MLGTKYAVAVLPLLIPLLIFPLVEGVITETILKDSLKWRSRGGLYFIAGSLTIPFVSLKVYSSKALDRFYSFMPYAVYFVLAIESITRIKTKIGWC